MLKTLCLITAVVFAVSCSTLKQSSLSEKELTEQAETYATKYRTKPYGFPPGMVVLVKGQLKETIYFDLASQRLGHGTYEKTPLVQFLDIIKIDNHVTYSNAETQIKHNLHSYYAEDCSSIENFFREFKSIDLEYREDKYALDFNSPTFEYFYKKNNLPISFTITTPIENHPISVLHKKALQAIKDCPHPKVPKYHKK